MLSSYGFILLRVQAIAMFFCLTCLQPASGQKSILDSTFTFKAGSVKISQALKIITKQSGYNFTYDSRLINPENRTEMTFINRKLNVILDSILKRDSLGYSVIDKYIIISRLHPETHSANDTLAWNKEIHSISGVIVDEESDDPLPFATVGIKSKGKGTVANNNGEFGLKISESNIKDTLSVSYLGYIGREIPVEKALGNNFTIKMRKEFISIPEILIRTQAPQEIITKALDNIPENYGKTPAMLTAFYREGVMKKQELQVYSEAILQIYKSAYSGSLLNDQIKVLKSRKIENLGIHDTLAIRLKAGLSTCMDLDGVRNIFDFISMSSMKEYTYRISDIVSFDEESAYVIDFEQKAGVNFPLFEGTMYINTSDYAILQVDFELNPKYIRDLKNSFVTSSSKGFSVWPLTVNYSVSYRKYNDRYFLNHVRGDLLFISRKKKQFFKSQFKVFFELAVTDIDLEHVTRFEREELAPMHSVFSRTITTYDPQFWGNQDFLKPEDNLLQALKNMKVRLKEFSK